MKGQIADMMEGQGGAKGKKVGAGSRFSVEELKELFKLRLDTSSDTHDLLCKGSASTGGQELYSMCSSQCTEPAAKNGSHGCVRALHAV